MDRIKRIGRELTELLRRKGPDLLKKDNLIILILAGVLLLVISLPTTKKDDSSKDLSKDTGKGEKTNPVGEDYARSLAREIESILSLVDGVGEVRVMITLQETRELVVEMEKTMDWQETREEDDAGGQREIYREQSQQKTVFASEQGEGVPLVVKERYPKIEGVLVIAQGAEKSRVKVELTQAIQALLGLEAHKVKVLNMGHISGKDGIQ